MISAILFYNEKGEVILLRNFRGDIRKSTSEAFRQKILAKKDTKFPIVQLGRVTFFYIRVEDVYIVACTGGNCNAAVVFESLYKLVEVFKSYFGGLFNEDTIKKHFPLMYELIDEAFDFGYPQNIDPEVLKTYIIQGKPITAQKAQQLSVHATGQSNRPPDLVYKNNEMYIDIIEQVDLLVSSRHTILNAEVNGQINLRVHLSGQPECIFGFNDKLFMDKHNDLSQRAVRRGRGFQLELDDIQFHKCVKLGRFNADRTIAFVPPDGDFTLMRYRISERLVKPPFNVNPVIIEHTNTRFVVQVTISSTFNPQFVATQVVVKIPVPHNTARTTCDVSIGAAKFEPTQHAIMWRITNFPGCSSTQITASVQLLASVVQQAPWPKPPIAMQFMVPMATSSGLEVLFMNITENKLNYQAERFIRYLTRGGNYLIRYPDTVGRNTENPIKATKN
ncbi:putative AP-2 complex subunit mu [Blattamonas nauphoetae]|uniref:AP-2 complex subunit mu n=1 Tax=Blattamonas nauphoetae TaxID=2049346 RepID=A0ABQ9Y6X1_9EUKA|nr:putative AP-2 complex subunit mu [Blattamonas nauphoetae]